MTIGNYWGLTTTNPQLRLPIRGAILISSTFCLVMEQAKSSHWLTASAG